MHSTLCPTGWQNFVPKGANDPEHRAPKGGIVVHVLSAVVRTVVRAIVRIVVVVVEHPRRGRNKRLTIPQLDNDDATQFHMAKPFPKNLYSDFLIIFF